jgi:hypothetical protein
MILIMSTNLIVYGVSQKRLLKIVFASIVIMSLNNAVLSAQKTNTAAWVKSTNCFKGFSSRVTISKIDNKKNSFYKDGYEYYAEVRNDYDRKVKFGIHLLVAGKREWMGSFTLNPGEIAKTQIKEFPTPIDSVKIQISSVCFSADMCLAYYKNGTCLADCDNGITPNIPPFCGTNFLSNYMLMAHYLYNSDAPSEAIYFYHECWQFGDDTAALSIGFVYLKQWEEQKEIYNPSKARSYFDTAVQNGNTNGYYAIGQMYEHGLGVNKDIPMAISFYEKGVAKTNVCCINALYQLYSSNPTFLNAEKAKDFKAMLDYLELDKKPMICRPEDYYGILFKVIN